MTLTARWWVRCAEPVRLLLLLGGACWLALPFRTASLVGGGDAVWYRHQVADAVTQFRAGVFPVFVGQTHAAFNGAVHPIRTAPALQYTAGLIDLLTGRALGFHTLLHLTAAASLITAVLVTYFGLTWLAPTARWRAALLAWVYVSAPGVLGLPYAQDLYMSTMAIPWVPLAFAGTVKVLQGAGWRAGVVLGAALGGLWWAHSPIALWATTGVAGVTLLSSPSWLRRRPEAVAVLQAGVVASLVLLALAAYPVASVLLLRGEGEAIVPRPLVRADLLTEVAQAFPAIVQPLRLDRPLLSFMQPGYAVLAVLVAAAVGAWGASGRQRATTAALVAVAALALVLILPVPGLTAWLWHHVPDLWANMTNIWPMQRVCIVIAAVAVVALQSGGREAAAPPPRSRRLTAGVVLGLVGVLWSAAQADVLRTLAVQRTRPVEERERLAREENVNVSEYCYQQLPGRPAYFIHGVTDPGMEMRLLDPGTGEVIVSNKAAVEAASSAPWHELKPTAVNRPDLIEYEPRFTLEPGARYLLTFAFDQDRPTGVLRLVGTTFERVYVLPSAGEPKGFGAGPDQEKSLVLWTTRDAPEPVRLQFLPAGTALDERRALGRVRLTTIDQEALPARVHSLIPLRLTVQTAQPVLLETTRMSVPGWKAEVDDKRVPVTRSSQGLVSLAVPPGQHEIVLKYVGPPLLHATFWISVAGWLTAVVAAAGMGFRCRWSRSNSGDAAARRRC